MDSERSFVLISMSSMTSGSMAHGIKYVAPMLMPPEIIIRIVRKKKSSVNSDTDEAHEVQVPEGTVVRQNNVQNIERQTNLFVSYERINNSTLKMI